MPHPKVSANAIEALLPQTQCGDCDYAGCAPYAKAMAKNNAPINKCLPGGVATLENLGKLLQQDVSDLMDDMAQKAKPKRLAIIREAECIGCTKCIQACPVDAIMGTAKFMHSVINSECTGCGLCVPPCPMDCIDLDVTQDQSYQTNHARNRFEARNQRLTKQAQQRHKSHREAIALQQRSTDKKLAAKKAAIAAAIARVKTKKHQGDTHDTQKNT